MMFHVRGWLLACALVLLAGCSQKMIDQPKVKPLAGSDFFADGQSARPVPPDTVSRGETVTDELLNTGKINGEEADMFPFPITREVLVRGQERYNIYCAVCHDRLGSAHGMVVQKGFSEPPILTSDRLIEEPAGYFFDVITNGFAAAAEMPPYGPLIPVRDRWAIVAYIRALQLSQHATLNDVPPEVRPTLEAQP
jgi:mono/diheme cytochrome c family protein